MTASAADWPESPFWRFSLDLYSQPKAEAACLTLQDEHGLDVNLVLLAAWLAHAGRAVEAASARRLRQLADGYQAAVMQPLRQARRALKGQAASPPLAALLAERRRALMAVELDLERVEQLMLEPLAGDCPDASSEPAVTLFAGNLRTLYPDRPVPAALLAAFADSFPSVARAANFTAEQAVKGITEG